MTAPENYPETDIQPREGRFGGIEQDLGNLEQADPHSFTRKVIVGLTEEQLAGLNTIATGYNVNLTTMLHAAIGNYTRRIFDNPDELKVLEDHLDALAVEQDLKLKRRLVGEGAMKATDIN